jgi:hypothetical protein
MRPRPQRGQGWRKGGEYFLKKRVSAEHNFKIADRFENVNR